MERRSSVGSLSLAIMALLLSILPGGQQIVLMGNEDALYLAQFRWAEAARPRQFDGRKPIFGFIPRFADMDVWWFAQIGGIKPEAITFDT